MINIDKVTTKSGDGGYTLGPCNQNVPKYENEIEFLGSLDELNASIGECIFYIENKEKNEILEKIQHQIFYIGAKFFKNTDIEEEKVQFLEENISKFNENLPKLESFLLPNGDIDVIKLHISRTIARKSERKFFRTKFKLKNIGVYLNRLSDLLFVFLREKSKLTWKI